MKTKIKNLLFVAGLITLTACASLNSTVFNSERLANDGAQNATHAFNQYYHSVTNGMTDAGIAQLNSTRDEIYAADERLADYLTTLDGIRLAYAAGATNQPAVLNALAAVQSQSTNIVAIVQTFVKQ